MLVWDWGAAQAARMYAEFRVGVPVMNGALPPPPGCSLDLHNAPQCPVLDPLQRGFTSGEVRLAFEVRSAAVRLELLGTLYTFCRYGWRPVHISYDRGCYLGGSIPCQYFPHKCEGCEDGTPQNLPAQHSLPPTERTRSRPHRCWASRHRSWRARRLSTTSRRAGKPGKGGVGAQKLLYLQHEILCCGSCLRTTKARSN